VRVETDDRRVGAGRLQPGDRAQRGETIPGGYDHRASVVGAGARHGAGHGGVQGGEPRPDLAGGQFGGDQFCGLGREVKVGQVLVQVIRNADDGHASTLADGVNTER
jgi:hypothetical protein